MCVLCVLQNVPHVHGTRRRCDLAEGFRGGEHMVGGPCRVEGALSGEAEVADARGEKKQRQKLAVEMHHSHFVCKSVHMLCLHKHTL